MSFMTMVLTMLRSEPTERVQEVEKLKDFDFFKDPQESEFREMEWGAKGLIQHEIMAQC